MEDLEEYTFATTYLQDWQHWEALCNSKRFTPEITQWRFELTKKLNSRALMHLKKLALDPDDKNFVQANRILLSKTEDIKTNNAQEQAEKVSKGPGRPSKPKNSYEEAVEEDYNRLIGKIT